MKRVAIGNLLSAAANVAMFADKMARSTRHLSDSDAMRVDPQELLATYLMSLAHLTDTAEWLELPATHAAALRCKAAFDRLRMSNLVLDKRIADGIVTNSHQLYVALSDELERHHAYIVAPREGELIDDGIRLFGLEVVDALPDIRLDVASAAKCRAYELWTASVMHMMRVAETGVGVLADHLGAKRGTSWGVTIANVQQSLDAARRAKDDSGLKRWAAETATYLAFVKDAFRNPAMHAEVNFTADQAISIYDNTRAFMRALVQRIGTST